MSVPARVGVTTLGVADVARATEFYLRLGWRLAPASVPGVVSWFHTGGAVLCLVATATRPDSGPRSAMLTVTVDSPGAVDAALRSVVQAGATLVRAGGRVEWGGYLGSFTDPDGHRWEITYHPDWPLDETGVPRLP